MNRVVKSSRKALRNVELAIGLELVPEHESYRGSPEEKRVKAARAGVNVLTSTLNTFDHMEKAVIHATVDADAGRPWSCACDSCRIARQEVTL